MDYAELIEGASVGPDVVVVEQANRLKHPRFVVVREDFRNKALASVAELP